MKSTSRAASTSAELARRAAGSAAVLTWLSTCASGPLASGMARADEPAKPAAETAPAPGTDAAGSVLACGMKGTQLVAKGTSIFDAFTAGKPIGTFTGAPVPLSVSQVPGDTGTGRAKLSTSAGDPTLRLDGYVALAALELYTTRDLPVEGPSTHVWMSAAYRVKPVAISTSGLTVEMSLLGSRGQKVRATAPCDAFSLERGAPRRLEPSDKARGYMTKKETLDLYDRASGSVVFTLRMTEGTGQLFWSTESKLGFVHVLSRGDVTVDAWARLKDLELLKKGELIDQVIPPSTAFAGAQLGFEDPPPLVKAASTIVLRGRRDAKERPIGAIEAGAEVYVLETVAGWTNVLPKSLALTPPDGGGFWIPAADAPKPGE